MATQRFYRVQSGWSFTCYSEEHEFQARGHYCMDYSHWLNRGKFERHLDWDDRSREPSPFISVYDSWQEAQTRARVLTQRRHPDVFIAEILLSSPQEKILDVGFSDLTVHLPTLQQVRDDTGGPATTFVSISAVRKYLRVGHTGDTRASEWFALDSVPNDLIVKKWQRGAQ
ncbi:Uu.00g039150.m01.CDS01 [Anthostomella pinea]|uniref:Uu.00g039150.m01.CDS01 n=1 Tax=Anthostomella pinea TaxID=933095 RepID=A0AAI8YDU0_9PEZI|nr:Uu.00g039150.m01.CDS01 [Anthostomella pinea]